MKPVLITLGCFLLLLALQTAFPKRLFAVFTTKRFWHNIALFTVNFILFAIVPVSLVSIANVAESLQLGLLNQIASLPSLLEILIVIVVMDFAVYWQHVASHRWSWLWRFHQVHHLDRQIDVTTAVRFHPIELFISLLFKGFCIFLLGASVLSVIIFEALLIIGAAFSHSNWRLPGLIDHVFRWMIVTPDVHRVHHSVHRHEHDNNYGFFLIWWDKLFSSYIAQPQDGHINMTIGLSYMRESKNCDEIKGMLTIPFKDI